MIITMSEVFQKKKFREWWKFTHIKYRMNYASFLNLVNFWRPNVEHEATNNGAYIEVDCAIVFVLHE